jgi:23S rRNA-intervening sequence protein
MSAYKRFEDLPVWQETARLYHSVLDFLMVPGLAVSPGFRDQLDRAGLSVSNNIAEAYERMSTKELINFLGIARGLRRRSAFHDPSDSSRKSMKANVEYINIIEKFAESCGKQIGGWIRSFEQSPIQGKRYGSTNNSEALSKKDHRERMKTRFFNLRFAICDFLAARGP